MHVHNYVKDIQNFDTYLQQETLIEKNSLTLPLVDYDDSKSIFLGTGIANKQSLSTAVPFDILMLVLMAEKLRRKCGLNKVCHLIADDHAAVNKFQTDDIRKIANQYNSTLSTIIKNLSFHNYDLHFASNIKNSSKYKQVLRTLTPQDGIKTYETLEATDIEYFRQNHRIGIKLGWAMTPPGRYDEVHFDQYYRKAVAQPLGFIYTQAGKRLSDQSPNAVPYTLFSQDLSNRLILSSEEDAVEKVKTAKCSASTKRMFTNHCKAIVRLYRSFAEIPKSVGKTLEQVNYIIHAITK